MKEKKGVTIKGSEKPGLLAYVFGHLSQKYREEGFVSMTRFFYDHIKRNILNQTITRFPRILEFYTPKLNHVFLELTNCCNLHCEMCYSGKRTKGYMSEELFKNMIDQLSLIGLNILTLHFSGESLLHPKFKEMLTYVISKRKTFKQIDFFSNGMLLTHDLADYLVENEIDMITFSLEGLGDVNDKIRKGADYEKIEKNILYLLEKRGNKRKPKIIINMTASIQTEKQILDFVKVWVNKVAYITMYGCIDENFQLIKNENFYNDTEFVQTPMCLSPFTDIVVLWNGDITTCCHELNGTQIMDNVNKQSILQIWKGEKYKKLRKACATKNFPHNSVCYTCNAWKYNFVPRRTQIDNIEITTEGLYRKFKRIE